MKNTGSILVWAAILCSVAAIVIYAAGAEGIKTPPAGELSFEDRADGILIDLSRFGWMEKPAVLFSHDLHTDALAKQNQDCFSCHLREKKPQSLALNPALQSLPAERMSNKFKRLEDTTAEEVRRIYHENCTGCHMALAEKKVKSGPVACGECHVGAAPGKSARKPMGFDLSLHYRHSRAAMEKCGLCHHEFDEKEKKLFHAEGKEGACRYCHRAEKTENRVAMSTASHLSCVECHRLGKEADQKSGPITCAGCHDAREQRKIEKVDPVPRMARNQPDAVFVNSLSPGEAKEITRMDPVPFEHKAHEQYNDTCRVCHHESMASCNTCHALGKPLKDGNYVKLEKAMHQVGSQTSCVGCHSLQQQQAKECAGCHIFKTETTAENQSKSCLKCHRGQPTQVEEMSTLSPEAEKEAATRLLQVRETVEGTYAEAEIPEKVVIKELVDQYEEVEFPHRKVVMGLVDRINGSKKASKLAAYFHFDKATVCQGCHHLSPASAKPPRCTNCHGKPFDEGNLRKPGIVGAYHQQCIGCHDAMEIQKPKECLDCHKERKLQR